MPDEQYVICHPGRGVFIGYKPSLVGDNGNVPHFRHQSPTTGKAFDSLDIVKSEVKALKRHGLHKCYIHLVKIYKSTGTIE